MKAQRQRALPKLAWSDMPYLLAVCETGSLAGAARLLGVNHSTVFRRVEGAETALGVRLFERQKGGYAMTAAGEWFHRRAGHLCEGMNAIETTLSGQDLRLEGKLTVTTTDSLLHCLTPVAHAFQVRHPDVTLRLLSDAQPLDLAQRDADIALRPTREPPPLWVGRKLHALPCAVYAHQDYWSIVSADAPATQRWILLDDDLHRAPMSQLAQAVKPAEAPSTVINTVMGVYDMVSAGLGLAALPCYLGDRNPALVAVHPGDSRYTWDLWLLAHPDVRRSARVHAFFDFAATAITAEQLATG